MGHKILQIKFKPSFYHFLYNIGALYNMWFLTFSIFTFRSCIRWKEVGSVLLFCVLCKLNLLTILSMVPRKFANMTFCIDVQTEQFLWAFVDCWTTLKYIFLNIKIWRVSTICTRWSMSCCVIQTLTSWRWTAMVWPRRSWPVPTSRTSLQCSSKSSSRPENHFCGEWKVKE